MPVDIPVQDELLKKLRYNYRNLTYQEVSKMLNVTYQSVARSLVFRNPLLKSCKGLISSEALGKWLVQNFLSNNSNTGDRYQTILFNYYGFDSMDQALVQYGFEDSVSTKRKGVFEPEKDLTRSDLKKIKGPNKSKVFRHRNKSLLNEDKIPEWLYVTHILDAYSGGRNNSLIDELKYFGFNSVEEAQEALKEYKKLKLPSAFRKSLDSIEESVRGFLWRPDYVFSKAYDELYDYLEKFCSIMELPKMYFGETVFANQVIPRLQKRIKFIEKSAVRKTRYKVSSDKAIDIFRSCFEDVYKELKPQHLFRDDEIQLPEIATKTVEMGFEISEFPKLKINRDTTISYEDVRQAITHIPLSMRSEEVIFNYLDVSGIFLTEEEKEIVKRSLRRFVRESEDGMDYTPFMSLLDKKAA
ncbi:MAG: hypothetical protein HY831_02715 [Candidatus Aenigmarchaeota archaeon]|nr:hypothetical protein [Candidatus Aenigmarchaeota archaeon]